MTIFRKNVEGTKLRRSCPECREGLLWFGSMLRGSTQRTSRCGHCGAEYRLHRGVGHYLLLAAIVIAALVVFAMIAESNANIAFKSVLGLIEMGATISIGRHIASLRLIQSGLARENLTINHSDDYDENRTPVSRETKMSMFL